MALVYLFTGISIFCVLTIVVWEIVERYSNKKKGA
jgi:hypothetical protein